MSRPRWPDSMNGQSPKIPVRFKASLMVPTTSAREWRTPSAPVRFGASWIAPMPKNICRVSKRLESKQLISVSAKQWYATAVRRLEHGDVDKLIGELGHAFDRSQDDDIRKQAEYFERNKDAVSYGDYRDHGGSTASSEVDSAHRHVVQKRLKIPGAWWHPDVRNILAPGCSKQTDGGTNTGNFSDSSGEHERNVSATNDCQTTVIPILKSQRPSTRGTIS